MTHVMVIDVGGTKTAVGWVSIAEDRVTSYTVYDTVPGQTQFPLFLGRIVGASITAAAAFGIVLSSTVVIALPGNFKAGGRIIPKKGSGRQLLNAKDTFPPGCLSKWLTQHWPPGLSVLGINDAQAQALGAIHDTWHASYANTTLLYLGLGTGLGGAIVRMGANPMTYSWVGDGHVYDALVSVDGVPIMAEDVLSGRGFMDHLGVSSKDVNIALKPSRAQQRYLERCVNICVGLVQDIQSGTLKKRDLAWSTTVRQEAQRVSRVILGGSLGTKGRIGVVLQAALHVRGIPTIQSMDPIQQALMGAYYGTWH
jgi:hypothetical protein